MRLWLYVVLVAVALLPDLRGQTRPFFMGSDHLRSGCWWTLTPADEWRGRDWRQFHAFDATFHRRLGDPAVLCFQRASL